MIKKEFYFPPWKCTKREEPAWIAGFIWGMMSGIVILVMLIKIIGYLIWGTI